MLKKLLYFIFISVAGCFAFTQLYAQKPGDRISVPGADGTIYTAVIKTIYQDQYQVKYDGYEALRWLNKNQFTLNNSIAAGPRSQNIQTGNAGTAASKLKTIYDFGEKMGWSSPIYKEKFTNFIAPFTASQQNDLLVFLQQAITPSARFFALKSLLTGETYPVLQNFINTLNKYPEDYQQKNCLVTGNQSIIQQWQYSCSVTMLQTYLADLSPRYAWEVKHIPDYDKIKNASCPMAQQQKELLEKYGGVATSRGDLSGTSIGINGPLKEFVSPILGVDFYAQVVDEPLPLIYTKIRQQLDRGINVPMLIGFVGAQSRHFILAMRYKHTANGYSFLIYDPWDGKCDYVTETSLLAGSLSPLQNQWAITLDYYYPVK